MPRRRIIGRRFGLMQLSELLDVTCEHFHPGFVFVPLDCRRGREHGIRYDEECVQRRETKGVSLTGGEQGLPTHPSQNSPSPIKSRSSMNDCVRPDERLHRRHAQDPRLSNSARPWDGVPAGPNASVLECIKLITMEEKLMVGNSR